MSEGSKEIKDFRGLGDESPPAGLRGTSPVWLPCPQEKNFNFRFIKHRKAAFCIYAVHTQALVFHVCVTHFKRK